jgi:DNA-binding NtrC family response regulator
MRSTSHRPAVAAPVLVYGSKAMRDVCRLSERVAAGDAKVLITGESGVGKDLVARYIHAHSTRASRPLVAVNCAGFTETLLESELFGHVKGSFTDAYRNKVGKLQLADGGTIFLDEVAEMSLRMQALLLRFLENGEIQPVGSDDGAMKVDVRVIAATNRELAEAAAAGLFRRDLMYRLQVVHVVVPSLRDRPEDVRVLVDHLVIKSGRRITFDAEARQALERYSWPGNVRELQNVVEQLIWTASSDVIGVSDLPPAFRSKPRNVSPVRERRRQLADDLFKGLVGEVFSFWDHVHVMFLNRDMTRHDIRELVRRGLATTGGNYRAMVRLFGMGEGDYKKFLNFLTAHDCLVDFHEFRSMPAADEAGALPADPQAKLDFAKRRMASMPRKEPVRFGTHPN